MQFLKRKNCYGIKILGLNGYEMVTTTLPFFNLERLLEDGGTNFLLFVRHLKVIGFMTSRLLKVTLLTTLQPYLKTTHWRKRYNFMSTFSLSARSVTGYPLLGLRLAVR